MYRLFKIKQTLKKFLNKALEFIAITLIGIFLIGGAIGLIFGVVLLINDLFCCNCNH